MTWRCRALLLAGPLGLALLQSAGAETILRAGGQGVQAPMNYVNADGVVTGVVVDILGTIAADVGFTVEHVTGIAVGDTIDALLTRRIDITEGTLAVTPDRAAVVAFSIPYMVQGEALVVKNDDRAVYHSLLDLSGLEVGAIRGSNYAALLTSLPAGTFAAIKLYEYPPDLLAAVAGRDVRAGIYGAPIAAWDIRQPAYRGILRLAENYMPSSANVYAFAVRNEDTELLDSVNASLHRLMEDGTIRAIFESYGLPFADYTR